MDAITFFNQILRGRSSKKENTERDHPDYPHMVNVHDFETYSQKHLPKNARDYYHSGANDMITLRLNRAVFADYCLLPRILSTNVTQVDLSTHVLGQQLAFPMAIAPWAMQKMAHPDGENATARAAQRMGTLMTLSSVSTTSLEDVAHAASSPESSFTSSLPPAPLWFQLYVYQDRNITAKLIDRAVAAGYKAIVVTVDTPTLGRREADSRNIFSLPNHLHLGNFQGEAYKNATKRDDNDDNNNNNSSGPALSTIATNNTTETTTKNPESALATYFVQQIDPSLTWQDIIPFIRERHPHIPIVLKGILTVEDAHLAVSAHRIRGIWISNHGARQLDTVPATLEVVHDIAQTCRNCDLCNCDRTKQQRTEIYVDGGFTRGTDVVKALLLGADCVFLGRPVQWGLAHSGEAGVCRVLQLLRDEVAHALRLLGCASVRELVASRDHGHNRGLGDGDKAPASYDWTQRIRKKSSFASLLPHERQEHYSVGGGGNNNSNHNNNNNNSSNNGESRPLARL